MKPISRIYIASTIIAAVTVTSASAVKIGFHFEIDGFFDGGQITGIYVGDDVNSDGLFDVSEISTYMMTWSGNAVTPTFSHGLDDLLAFNVVPYGTPILIHSRNTEEPSSLFRFSAETRATVAVTGHADTVLPGAVLIPEAGSTVLLLAGSLAAIFGIKQRVQRDA